MSATAGSRLISVPNAVVVRRRSASISSANGITGTNTASPIPLSTMPGASATVGSGRATRRATTPATGIETARPWIPATSSPTSCVSRMYAAQHAAAASANAMPRASATPCQGSVSRSTPTAAVAGQSFTAPRPRAIATPSGPRNSSALAVPSGSRATAAMKQRVMAPVTTPSADDATSPRREKALGRGRTSTSSRTPAHARRSAAAPSAPTSSNRPIDAAIPIWTQTIAASAMPVPARARACAAVGMASLVIRPVNRRHTIRSRSTCLTYRSVLPNDSLMDPHRLRLLLELSRRGSMRAVADELGYTTSTVSQQLAVLAREAGATLIEPEGRRVRLTPAGRRLADHAVTILAALDAARADLDPGGEPAGTVRVAGFATAVRRSLVPVLAQLSAEHPAVRLRIHEHEPAEAFELLAADEVDLALVYDYTLAPVAFDPALRVTPLWTAAWELGVPAVDDAAATARDAAPAVFRRFAGAGWIVNSRNAADEHVVRTIASLAGFEPRIAHRAASLELVQDLIVAGLGVGLLPPDGRLVGGVRRVPLRHPDVALRSYAVTRPGRDTWAPLRLVMRLLAASG